MANVNASELDKLHVGEVIISTAQPSNSKEDKSKKAEAALLHTLSCAVDSAEKSTHKHHAHVHSVDTTLEELDDSVDADQNVDENEDLRDSDSQSGGNNSQDQDSEVDTQSHDSDNSDCLLKLMMAGIEVSSSKNGEIDATSAMGVKLSEASTNVAKLGQTTVENYYKYGIADGANMGDLHTVTRNAGDLRQVQFKIDLKTGHLMMLHNQTSPTWTDLGPAKKTSSGHYDFSAAEKKGYGSVYNHSVDPATAADSNIWNSSTDELAAGGTITLTITGPADTYMGNDDGTGGIAQASSADQSVMMNELQFLQSTASEVNNQIGNVASIPGTTLQGETQSVTSAQQSAQTATQIQQSIASQASTLASI